MMDIAPILLFVYNRPWHARRTLEALSENDLAESSKLYVFCDGPKHDVSPENLEKIRETRRVVKEKQWANEVIVYEQESNRGLAVSIIEGVTEVLGRHGKAIILEDDLVTSKGFLSYMNDALNFYEHVEKVMHVSAYWFPVKNEDAFLPETFFYRSTSCWGWGTWKRAWDKLETDPVVLRKKILQTKNGRRKFDIENSTGHFLQLESNIAGKIKTWAVKWYASVFLNNGLCLHPGISLVNNIGFDNSGVHCDASLSNQYQWGTLATRVRVKDIELVESRLAIELITKFYRRNDSGMIRRIKKLLPVGFKSLIKEKLLGHPFFYPRNSLAYLRYYPRYNATTVWLDGTPVKIVDSASFLFMYNEIFKKEIFRFQTQGRNTPYIIDGGANVGLATIYFKKLYPKARIVAFEPDPTIFKVLAHNIAAFNFSDVTLVNKALANKETDLEFFSEGADAGRIGSTAPGNGNIIKVKAIRLQEFLRKEKVVDFLKLDIEGAEVDVLNDIKNNLENVRMMFIEYHSFQNKQQRLNELISVLTDSGFRIYVNTPGLTPENPFQNVPVISDMDMQLNVYAIKK